MRKLFIFLLLVSPVLAESWYVVKVDLEGKVKGVGTNFDAKPTHVYLENEYPISYTFPTNDFKFWKKVGNDWVAMTVPEQQALIDAKAEIKASTENWKTNSVDGETLADAFRTLIICINKRLPATNRITALEFKTELKEQLKQ